MILSAHITEKSFGDKRLMHDVKFSVDDGEKVGVVGRNGVGKSTLFGILAGTDADYTGEVIFRRGSVVAATAQEHHDLGEQTVLDYVLDGLPEYGDLKKIIDEYPLTMGDNMRLIAEYTDALARFEQKGFYQIEQKIERELEQFQLADFASRPMRTLSGGQKRLIEIVKIMHAQAHLALIDEPTNHMDYAAKQQFIDWMRGSETGQMAMLIITHDRDVLARVDRIIEIKDGQAVSYRGNYDDYLRQNTQVTAAGMSDYEHVEKRIKNLQQKVLDYQRLKEKARNPGTIQNFKRLENEARAELARLEQQDKPTFWIDQDNVAGLGYKAAGNYQKYKTRNIRLSIKDGAMRSQRKLVEAREVAIGYGDDLLFESVNFDVREGEAVELRGRNGAGKSTLVRMLLDGAVEPLAPPLTPGAVKRARIECVSAERSLEISSGDFSEECTPEGDGGARGDDTSPPPTPSSTASARREASSDSSLESDRSSSLPASEQSPLRRKEVTGSELTSFKQSSLRRDESSLDSRACADVLDEVGGGEYAPILYDGTLALDPHVRVGIYEQEIAETYLDLPLNQAIEQLYLSRDLPISETKIRQLLADYLFTESDMAAPIRQLSGGQKARFQLIAMLAGDPQLLILDEPTNHLDLPSIEELETALAKYSGAILYISHDNYFRQKLSGEVVKIGEN